MYCVHVCVYWWFATTSNFVVYAYLSCWFSSGIEGSVNNQGTRDVYNVLNDELSQSIPKESCQRRLKDLCLKWLPRQWKGWALHMKLHCHWVHMMAETTKQTLNHLLITDVEHRHMMSVLVYWSFVYLTFSKSAAMHS